MVLARTDAQGRPERVTGIIDRLVVRPDRVDVIDYKTNRWNGDPAAAGLVGGPLPAPAGGLRRGGGGPVPGPHRARLAAADRSGGARRPTESPLVEVELS